MRVLFVVSPGVGHAFPLVPLVWAVRSAGHDVLVASHGPAMEGAGLVVVDTMPGFDMATWIRGQPEFAKQAQPPGGDRGTDLSGAFAFLAKHSDLRTDGVVAVATRWRPDLLVQSHVDGAGLVAAGKLGIPLVNHGFGFSRIGADEYAKVFREHMADAFERHGVTGAPRPNAMIQVAPPSMTGDTTLGWPMRYVPFNGGGQRPQWLDQVDAVAILPFQATPRRSAPSLATLAATTWCGGSSPPQRGSTSNWCWLSATSTPRSSATCRRMSGWPAGCR